MPTGIYKRTEQSRINMSNSRKGKKQSLEHIANRVKKLVGKKRPPMSKEWKEKLRQAKLRNPVRYWLGKHISTEHNRKLQEGKNKMEHSSQWKGGINPINDTIRKSIEMKLWKGAVFSRDNYTCQKCKIKSIKLNAHHIYPFAYYPELRFAIDNGITKCVYFAIKGFIKGLVLKTII